METFQLIYIYIRADAFVLKNEKYNKIVLFLVFFVHLVASRSNSPLLETKCKYRINYKNLLLLFTEAISTNVSLLRVLEEPLCEYREISFKIFPSFIC